MFNVCTVVKVLRSLTSTFWTSHAKLNSTAFKCTLQRLLVHSVWNLAVWKQTAINKLINFTICNVVKSRLFNTLHDAMQHRLLYRSNVYSDQTLSHFEAKIQLKICKQRWPTSLNVYRILMFKRFFCKHCAYPSPIFFILISIGFQLISSLCDNLQGEAK